MHNKKQRHSPRVSSPKATSPKAFWNAEYATHEHFALSNTVIEELERFTRYIERNHGGMPRKQHVLDVGCGNGRNIIWLGNEYDATGTGFDFSETALTEAHKEAGNVRVNFRIQDIADRFPEENDTYDMVIDFMSSHILVGPARNTYLQEVLRVLKPGGWFVLKTLLRDDDGHASRLLKEAGTDIQGVYIHPKTGAKEYAGSEDELTTELSPYFDIEKKQKSHAHKLDGKPNKRRFIVYYLVKPKG
jgi:SAM-dependent methyltransferase